MSPYNLKKGAIMPMKIEKRKTIDDTIYDELAKKHPVKSEKGVCYVQSMDYITLEVEAFNNPVFRKLIKQNSQVLIVYMYIRERMCHIGWHIPWDNETKEDVIERLTLWGISEEESQSIINALIDKQVIRSFRHDDTQYLTDVQQIYNWEMLQARRARERQRKRNASQQKSTSTQSSSYQQEPDYPPIECFTDMGYSGEDDELPFT